VIQPTPPWGVLTPLLLASSVVMAQEPEDAARTAPPDEPVELAEEITVTAGHGERRIQDVPLRVEVVNREEIEEKALMTPGSVAMLLGETTGLRVQTTAPSTSAANVRIQGLRGRYTLLLSDGLPLYGTGGGSLSLLQVPPLDLGQVEIVKGAASALYGPSAIGGVVNLVSQRPEHGQRQALVNASTQQALDATAWLAEPRASRAGSLLAGFHGQRAQDPDGDGWSDLPSFARGVLRPRMLWDNGAGRSLFATASGMAENRDGGTEPGALAPDGLPFAQDLDSRQADLGLVGRVAFARGLLLSVRGSFTHRREDRRLGDERERGRRTTAFGEAVLGGSSGAHTWLVGAAVESDAYSNQDLERFDYDHLTPGLFAQDEVRLGSRAVLGVSARVDHQDLYGTFLSARASLLVRPARGMSARLSAGTGFFTPTPFLEENDESGLARVLPLAPGLLAERARSASFDLGLARGRVELNATLFGSRVEDALQRRQVAAAAFAVVNAGLPVRTWGTELLVRYRRGGLMLMATHSYTSSSEEDPESPGARREVPLTPGHVASVNAIWEDEARGRIGVEAYYIGRQPTDENPYRTQGRAYLLFGALGEKRFGRARVFLNLENLGNVRQTRFEPLLLPARAADGRFTVDAWAPLDGFVANGGVRVGF
jgi:outer membrane receptor for ferrienterochelin and colicins